MSDQTQIKQVENFIRAHSLGVLATVSQAAKPEAAVVGYVMRDDLSIVFGTFSTSRKYQNLKLNASVNMVIGWDEGQTVQVDGTAEEIMDPIEINDLIVNHLSKIPSVTKFFDKPDQRLFCIKPSSIRYSDLSVEPWEYFTINF